MEGKGKEGTGSQGRGGTYHSINTSVSIPYTVPLGHRVTAKNGLMKFYRTYIAYCYQNKQRLDAFLIAQVLLVQRFVSS